MPHRVGYCCINNTLQKQGVTTGRTMRRATFEERGLAYASELATKNLQDLVKILVWNEKNNIQVFRMGSNIFPWNSEYKLEDLPDHRHHLILLAMAGSIAEQSGQRVTAHPDHFVKLASKKPDVVKNAIRDLRHHAEVFDLMGLSQTRYNCINIHVGQSFSPEVVECFNSAVTTLPENVRRRLVVENDDKDTGFSVLQLYNHIYLEVGTPITFDYFHHTFHTDTLPSEVAATIAATTWADVTPLFHYSESKNINESVSGNPRAHSDYALHMIDDFGLTIDIDLEVKQKELAVFNYNKLRSN